MTILQYLFCWALWLWTDEFCKIFSFIDMIMWLLSINVMYYTDCFKVIAYLSINSVLPWFLYLHALRILTCTFFLFFWFLCAFCIRVILTLQNVLLFYTKIKLDRQTFCPFDLLFSSVFPYWFSIWMIYALHRLLSLQLLRFCYCSLQICQCLLYRSKCFYAGCIFNCYTSLSNWPFSLCV